MNKQELIRDMKKEIGSFPNITQIAEYMGTSRKTVRTEIVAGLDYLETGRSKQYFVNDIAARILMKRAM